MSHIQESIKNFYNSQAEKFSQTRKRNWPEFFYIKEEVEKLLKKKQTIKVLELGCGDGRAWRYLQDLFPWRIIYTGVDLSEGLIQIAKTELDKQKNNYTKISLVSKEKDSETSLEWQIKKVWNKNLQYNQTQFIVSDMLSFLENQDQQSYDFVFAVASFQHIGTKYERLLILKNIYRVLEYDGVVQMFNWSFSHWFFKKYTRTILKSFLLWLLTLFTRPLNDIYIPWKDKDKIYYRYYHIFFIYELKNLFKLSGFVIKELCYITKNWIKSVSRKDSRNSMIIGKKSIIKLS